MEKVRKIKLTRDISYLTIGVVVVVVIMGLSESLTMKAGMKQEKDLGLVKGEKGKGKRAVKRCILHKPDCRSS